jgi:2-polyprenyl-3-methyl-5-hydroxy-6-metoxy-1,4-benzoquinol methylase
MTCPLCLKNNSEYYHQDKFRDYWQCNHCQLVFVKSEQYLSLVDEKAVYDQHQNSPDNQGYRNFLNKLLLPLTAILKNDSHGLDFGCGPGATISVMLKEEGFLVSDYDIFYVNNPELLKQVYDFITCTEVIEHLHNPYQELNLLSKLLKPKGYLGIMTKRVIDKQMFSTWHYKNDLTHVCFYSVETFEYIAKHWVYDLDIINSDTVILQKR